MKTNIKLVQYAEKALRENWGYCLGSFGNVLTPAFLAQKMAQGSGVGAYNTRHKAYLEKFLNKRVTDCYGLVKAFLWDNSGTVKYVASQDRNQEGAFNAAKEKGPLSNMPEIPGLILWMKGHAGIYIGNGEFIECVGAPVGMRKGKIVNGKITSGSRFTHWFKDTYITYESSVVKPGIVKLNLRGRIIELPGYLENSTNYVIINGKKEILRDYLEGLGLTVSWDQNDKTVVAI